jgi:H+/Cl- antiporter ClcA
MRTFPKHLRALPSLIKDHRYGFVLFAYLSAAIATGVSCVLFMRVFEFVLERRLDFGSIGTWCFLTTPVLFLFSVLLMRRYAPHAEGTGIPQVVFASRHMTDENAPSIMPLLSPVTFLVKIVALLIGLWAGASTGREGPTVHIAAGVFLSVMMLFRRWFGVKFDWRSVVIAGGAAGLAAAFNTPLAGVTFAIEELSSDYFSAIKDYVIMAIIFASLAALALTGQYSYFGILKAPTVIPVAPTVLIGVIGGALGAFFSTALIKGSRYFRDLRSTPARWLRPVLLSLVVIGIAYVAGLDVLGPGNKVAKDLLDGHLRGDVFMFPLAKLAATLATYWSGLAGGIFAPCLAIGASMGSAIGTLLTLSIAPCALVGMAAFLSGSIQAPLTAFVIIFEMTGNHEMLIPVMLASLVSFIVARLLKAGHLYSQLAETYQPLIDR